MYNKLSFFDPSEYPVIVAIVNCSLSLNTELPPPNSLAGQEELKEESQT